MEMRYVLEQELEKVRAGGENMAHGNGHGSGNPVAGGNSGANGLSSSRYLLLFLYYHYYSIHSFSILFCFILN